MNVNEALATLLSMWDELAMTEKISMMHDIYRGFTKIVLDLERADYDDECCAERGLIALGDTIMEEHVESIKTFMEKYEKIFK